MNKHVLILTPGFPKDEFDDTCIPSLQKYLFYLSQNNSICVSIISLHYPFTYKKYVWNKIAVYPCGGENKGWFFKIITWFKVYNYFKIINRKRKVDIIHSFWLSESAFVGNFISKKNNIPHIITLMGQELRGKNNYLPFINLRYPKIVAISKVIAEQFNIKTKQKVNEIIPWGIEPTQLNGKNEERIIDFLGVGSLSRLKNYKLFIEIIEEIRKYNPLINSVIIGEGRDENFLRQIISQKKLEQNIKLYGKLSNNETLKIMRKSKVLLHPSEFESFGYVYIEALKMGMNILSFKTGIANPGKSWKIASNKEEMIGMAKQLQSCNVNNEPIILYDITNTIKYYCKIYEIK